jgi:hypothetical protein
LSIRAGDCSHGPLFLEFSFIDTVGSKPKVDHAFVVSSIVPRLGILEKQNQKYVQIEKIEQVHRANCQPSFLISNCSVSDFNQTYYIKMGQTSGNTCVFADAQAKTWLFYESGFWKLGSDSALIDYRLRGKACPESPDDPARSSDWEVYSSSSGSHVIDSKMDLRRHGCAWRVEFSVLGDPAERAKGVSQFLSHIHTNKSKAIFQKEGLILLDASVSSKPAELEPDSKGGLTGTVCMLLRKCRDQEPPGYCSSGPFKVIVRSMIDRVRAPAELLAVDVRDIALQCLADHIKSLMHALPEFQLLAKRAGEVAIARLHEKALSAALIEVEKEHAVLFTNNKYFANTVAHMREAREAYVRTMLGGEGRVHGGNNEEAEVQETEDKILAYAKVVYKRVADSVPMAVHYALVLHLAREVHSELMRVIMRMHAEGGLDACLAEGPGYRAEREACSHLVEQLRKAVDLLQQTEME